MWQWGTGGGKFRGRLCAPPDCHTAKPAPFLYSSPPTQFKPTPPNPARPCPTHTLSHACLSQVVRPDSLAHFITRVHETGVDDPGLALLDRLKSIKTRTPGGRGGGRAEGEGDGGEEGGAGGGDEEEEGAGGGGEGEGEHAGGRGYKSSRKGVSKVEKQKHTSRKGLHQALL